MIMRNTINEAGIYIVHTIILNANLIHVSLPLNPRAGMLTDTLQRRNSYLLRKIQLCFLFTSKSLLFSGILHC